jgi:ParB family chromosome partitioning protein
MSGAPLRRRGLGRGLDALIVNTGHNQAAPSGALSVDAPVVVGEAGVRTLALERIRPNPRQPRTRFDETSLAELAASIRTHGIIQPLVVTADPHHADSYWLVTGERRWRAAQMAGLTAAPVIVRESTPQQLLELALIENIQRDDLNPLEEANAYAALAEEFGLTQSEIAERVGKSRSAVANTMRLLRLPPSAQQALVDGLISAGHARALLSLDDASQMDTLLGMIVQRDLTVRQTETLAKKLLNETERPSAQLPADQESQAHLVHMENRFRSVLGTRVALNRNADGSGRLIVHFYSDADLNALYQLIAGEEDGE